MLARTFRPPAFRCRQLLPASAETSTIKAAKQYGLSYLPLMIMEDQKLVEKHAAALGLGDLKVQWVTLGGPSAMNDALLSGGLDFASGGVPSLATLWAKTRNTPLAVHGVGALNDMPVDLVTSNPTVKKLSDFSDKDKIAVTSVKISTQALLLEMACAKEFGEANYEKYQLHHRLHAAPGSDGRADVRERQHRCALLVAAVPVHRADEYEHPHGAEQLRDLRRPGDFQCRVGDQQIPQ